MIILITMEALTSIQHRGLPAFVPHTIIVSFTFWMTVMKLSHSICERKRREIKAGGKRREIKAGNKGGRKKVGNKDGEKGGGEKAGNKGGK